MNTALHKRTMGFTIVEVMIAVAIIALLASIAAPNILRSRKRAQATKILDDLRNLDSALEQWSLEGSRQPGDVADFSDLQPYLKQANKLNLTGYDSFGQTYGPFIVDEAPKVAAFTFNMLSDVAPAEFWSPYH
jgi:prepilin-type N-terminal cleavage/methylation domain-containing protein